jgi:hypothetical protein
VVHEALDYFVPNANSLQAGRDGAPQVVETPRSDILAHRLVDCSFDLRANRDWRLASSTYKNKRTASHDRHFRDDLTDQRRQDQHIRPMIFRSGGGNSPNASVKLSVTHTANFIQSLASEQQHL